MALAWHCYGAFWAFDGVWQPIGIDWHLASRNCWHQAWFHTSVGSIGSVHRPPGCPGQRWPARSVDEGPDWTTENSYDGIPHTRIPTTEKNDKTWQNSRSEIGNWDSHRPFIQQMTWHSLPNMQIGTCFRLILTRHSWTSAFLTIYTIYLSLDCLDTCTSTAAAIAISQPELHLIWPIVLLCKAHQCSWKLCNFADSHIIQALFLTPFSNKRPRDDAHRPSHFNGQNCICHQSLSQIHHNSSTSCIELYRILWQTPSWYVQVAVAKSSHKLRRKPCLMSLAGYQCYQCTAKSLRALH